jgi:nicotinate-nucleotide--dimethylbenzimidazole phosphoribosyltransferase
MVRNFLNGGAAINVLARQIGARVVVADFGVAGEILRHPELRSRRVRSGTENLAVGPAMSREDALQGIAGGIGIVDAEVRQGLDLLALGEMGIANTTAASAIVAVLTGRAPAEVTGPGTGLDQRGWEHKVTIVEQTLAVNQPDPADPLDVLAKLGGFEIAGLVGGILAALAARVPVLLDGFIVGAAALIAARLNPQARTLMLAAHRSAEPGHTLVLRHLDLCPLLELDLRLGEGTGATLAMPLVDAAAALLNEMATFSEAGVANRHAEKA